MNHRNFGRIALITLITVGSAACVQREVVYRPAPVQRPAEHPAYLHALSDLREARWLIMHRDGEGVANGDEQAAVDEIGAAIAVIRQAAIDDGKDVNYAPPGDAPPHFPGRLHAALSLLRRVHDDLAREEDNGYAQGLRDRALGHTNAAAGWTERAVNALRNAQ